MKLAVIASGEPGRELQRPRRGVGRHRGDPKVLKPERGGAGLEELA